MYSGRYTTYTAKSYTANYTAVRGIGSEGVNAFGRNSTQRSATITKPRFPSIGTIVLSRFLGIWMCENVLHGQVSCFPLALYSNFLYSELYSELYSNCRYTTYTADTHRDGSPVYVYSLYSKILAV